MGQCENVREKYLDEYISELNIDENVKERMLYLCNKESEERSEQARYLHNCHKRIDELEKTIVELSTDLATAKRFIREQI